MSFNVLISLILSCYASLVFVSVANATETVEQDLLKALTQIQQGQFNSALQDIDRLAEKNRKYKLAQLLKAEMLAIKSGDLGLLNEKRIQNKKKIDQLLLEAKLRWQTPVLKQHNKLIQQYVLKPNNANKLIIVSTDTNRLYLYENSENGYQQLANYYVSIGRKGTGKTYRGDLKTPIGIYSIKQQIADKDLADLYGIGALTLSYPNDWDKKQGRTGSGIWLHGTPRSTFSRAPLASRGCVVLNNPAMQTLLSKHRLDETTPVIIAKNEPLALAENTLYDHEKQEVLVEINSWLVAKNQKLDWSSVAVFAYPGEEDLYYISYQVEEKGKQKLIEHFWQKPTRIPLTIAGL
jgi:L,D-peptidoglycan transpeptidase YkuD (ErfK/YbiS/YcfS/YnhG family)